MWASAINLNGIYEDHPVEIFHDKEEVDWWDIDGDFSISKIGLHVQEYNITFSSEKEEDVQIFIDGAMSMCTLLANLGWCKFNPDPTPDPDKK